MAALLQTLPKAQAESKILRYAEGLTNYHTIKQHLVTFAQTLRFDGAFTRGDNDMDIGALDNDEAWENMRPEYQVAFAEAKVGA